MPNIKMVPVFLFTHKQVNDLKQRKKRFLWVRVYHACWQCQRRAQWHYSPCDEEPAARYRCDACVPRGCNCEIDTESGEAARDKKGRLLPCGGEWFYSANGWKL